uniref:Fibrinogen C-terminal domain-containing protein n=1 Tax=Clytia hemisphaerica TaxID=252671 RepID=A0A7M5UV99_9CNID
MVNKAQTFYVYLYLYSMFGFTATSKRYELIGHNKKPTKEEYSTASVKFEQHCFSKCHHDERCASFLVETVPKTIPFKCHFYSSTTTNLTHYEALEGSKVYTDIKDCSDLYNLGYKATGIYPISLPGGIGVRDVRCNMDVRGGGWMVFTYRMDGEHNWFADWETYKNGFGQHPGDFYMGNELIHKITSSGAYEFYYISEKGDTTYEGWHETFFIDDESNLYPLRLQGKYDGNMNGLRSHRGKPFSSSDQDNDPNNQRDCANTRQGSWWWTNCGAFNPHGRFHSTVGGICMGISKTICTDNFQLMFRRKN